MSDKKKNEFARENNLMGNTDVTYDLPISGYQITLEKEGSIIDFDFSEENNEITVTLRKESLLRETPDKVWREIYGVVDGKIQLIDRIDGDVTPGYYVEEVISFEYGGRKET